MNIIFHSVIISRAENAFYSVIYNYLNYSQAWREPCTESDRSFKIFSKDGCTMFSIIRMGMMKKITLAAISFAATLAFTSSAFAASTDFIDNNTYTTDKLSGLDWLDVTTTQGMAFNTIETSQPGWRLATVADFKGMVSNYFDLTSFSGTSELFNFGSAELSSLPLLQTWLGLTGSDLTQGFLSGNLVARLTYSQWSGTADSQNAAGFANDYSDADTGAFLVRDSSVSAVPVPAAAFLFAPALIGFAALRRRKQQD